MRAPLYLCLLPLTLAACFNDPGAEPSPGDDEVSPTETESDADSSSGDSEDSSSDEATTTSSEGESDASADTETTAEGCRDPLCLSVGVSVGAGFEPVDLALADIDGDGREDLITANAGGDNVAVLHALGEGDFDAPTFYGLGGALGPASLAALDVDPEAANDGGVDLMVGCADSLVILLNTGSAVAFEDPEVVELGAPVLDMAKGNFTLDSTAESVIGASDELGILITHGTGTGISSDLDAYPTPAPSKAVAAGMISQDPYSDFISISDQGTTASLIYFLPDPPYLEEAELGLGGPASDLILASLDANPVLDLVVSSAADEQLILFADLIDGVLPNGVFIDVDGQPDHLAVGDMNDDGTLDIIYADEVADEVGVLLGGPDLSFGTPLVFPVGQRPSAVLVADLDEDGLPDIVTANADDDNLTILFSQAD
ncbi:hypothetical protein PPSIR1_22334 [Plesiocystis pacifica SIR-1]|uniref:Uncharacterized protein n=1 Tax=Plesiocystis pacifica SIR-1 TaxID=391625 RepID=A6FXW4_9BACT|nr:VCBS repeat-containing protein [Plesiocystis pacifica]EDM81702.1 hypothetical protein PPSIR1_22334 [Plesiocystis pacifica SIR-1]